MDTLTQWAPELWRWLLGAGVLAPVVLIVAVIAAGIRYPGYKRRAQFVNELGTANSPVAWKYNAAVAVTGLLIGLFAAGVWRVLEGAPMTPVMAGGLAVFGGGTLLMGLFRCEPGCPPAPGTVSGWIHTLAAVLAGVGGPVASLAFGFWAADQAGGWLLTLYSLISGGGALALLFTALGAVGTGFEGLLQRLYLLVILAWLGVAAGWLYLRTMG